MRSVPSGTRIILCTTAAVPTSCRSSQPGSSISESRTVTSASIRSPVTTSSTSLTERSCPIASGETDCGKTTVSFSGRTGRIAGISTSPCSSCSSNVSSDTARPDRDGHALALALGRLLRDRKDDGEEATLVPCRRGCGVDGLGQGNAALEGPVLDLHLLVAAGQLGAAALAGNDEDAVGRNHLDRARVDARQLDEDMQRRWILAADAIDVRPEAAARDDETRNVPEVVHELVDLVVQPVDVVSLSHLWGQR